MRAHLRLFFLLSRGCVCKGKSFCASLNILLLHRLFFLICNCVDIECNIIFVFIVLYACVYDVRTV